MNDIISEIQTILARNGSVTVAIDGRCASGKTTLASRLQAQLGGNVYHMDDFFLRPEQRTEERLRQPGGNVDRERFLQEILIPLQQKKPVCYRPFCCQTMLLGAPISVPTANVNIIEGSYSCHPDLWDCYDLHIFLTVSPNEQLKRLSERNPEKLTAFIERWIPLEERYFSFFDIESRCEKIYEI